MREIGYEWSSRRSESIASFFNTLFKCIVALSYLIQQKSHNDMLCDIYLILSKDICYAWHNLCASDTKHL